jgi:uncharacterized protein (TIGR03067 family)
MSEDPLDGTWQLVRAEHGGEEAPELVVQRTRLLLASGSYAVEFDGETVDRGSFEMGGVAGAYTLLLRGLDGPNAGRMIPCLFQLRGNLLRVCYGFDGLAPTEFSTDTKNHRYLATYRRE